MKPPISDRGSNLERVLERDASGRFVEPDLLDAVVGVLDWRTALALRATCRSLNSVVCNRVGPKIDATMAIWRAPDVARRVKRLAPLFKRLTPFADASAAIGDPFFAPVVDEVINIIGGGLRQAQLCLNSVLCLLEQTDRLRSQALALVDEGKLSAASLGEIGRMWMRPSTPRFPRRETRCAAPRDAHAVDLWLGAHVARWLAQRVRNE